MLRTVNTAAATIAIVLAIHPMAIKSVRSGRAVPSRAVRLQRRSRPNSRCSTGRVGPGLSGLPTGRSPAQLRDEGVPTKKGGEWAAATVRSVLLSQPGSSTADQETAAGCTGRLSVRSAHLPRGAGTLTERVEPSTTGGRPRPPGPSPTTMGQLKRLRPSASSTSTESRVDVGSFSSIRRSRVHGTEGPQCGWSSSPSVTCTSPLPSALTM